MTPAKQDHWEHIYESKAENELSWFQERPVVSLDLIRATGAKPSAAIIDIGGGASRLVDALLDEGFHASVLDISEKALAATKARLGPRAAKVAWIAADVTAWEPSETYDDQRGLRGARGEGRAARRPCRHRHIRTGRTGTVQWASCHAARRGFYRLRSRRRIRACRNPPR